jgi:transcriptional regulator with PAS, ATPase and Fis domain
MPSLKLTDDAIHTLTNFSWPGNIRQLKNITEQISIIEKDKLIDSATLQSYLPSDSSTDLPILYSKEKDKFTERELLYKVLFDMKKDVSELKKIVLDIIDNKGESTDIEHTKALLVKDFGTDLLITKPTTDNKVKITTPVNDIKLPANTGNEGFENSEVIEESLSLQDKEHEMIKAALEKHRGKRKNAANELGISERTLYRKIKEYNIK